MGDTFGSQAAYSDADFEAINAAFAAWVLGHKHQPANSDWPDILGPELFHRALQGGFFAPGAYPGLVTDDSEIVGAQVSTTQLDQNAGDDEGKYLTTLYVNGKIVATELSNQPAEQVAFAAKYGVAI